jgi:hypothetical protein
LSSCGINRFLESAGRDVRWEVLEMSARVSCERLEYIIAAVDFTQQEGYENMARYKTSLRTFYAQIQDCLAAG